MFLIDSNVLIDIAEEDPDWQPWSSQALATAANLGPVCINAIVFAEVSAASTTSKAWTAPWTPSV